MQDQIDLLMEMRTRNPTEAIGKAKELVESCCKTILEEYGVSIDSNWDVAKLSKETAKCLRIDVDSPKREDKIVKQIPGSLQGIANGLAEFRNAFGSGHGKSDNFVPLPIRHAKLAVGSAVTLVEYYWETFEWRKGVRDWSAQNHRRCSRIAVFNSFFLNLGKGVNIPCL